MRTRFLCLSLLLLSLSACGRPNAESEQGQETDLSNEVRLQLTLPSDATTGRYRGTYSDVQSIRVLVYDDASTLTDNLSLVNESGTWSATSSNLLQTTYTFVGSAFSDTATQDDTTLLFQGQTTQTLDNATVDLQLRLLPVRDDASESLAVPRITQIQRSATMAPNDNQTITVTVAANAGDELNYEFREAAGSFAPDNGSYVLTAATSSQLVSSYRADSTSGNFTHSVLVENQAGLGVETAFSILVEEQAEQQIELLFSPVILNLEGSLIDPTTIRWRTVVSDDTPDNLSATWQFAPSKDFGATTRTVSGDNATFEVTMSGYDAGESGSLTLSVTSDAGDNTTLTYPIVEEQFTTQVSTQGVFTERISAGDNFTCALKQGDVRCWGDNASGQLGNNNLTTAQQLSAGAQHACALFENGTVQCWGDISGPPSVSNARQVASGGNSSCVINNVFETECWGDNASAQLPPNATPSIWQLDVGANHSCAVQLDGSVACWGDNASGQLGSSGIDNATQVSVGDNHSCAVLQSGAAHCWGDNASGQLGDGLSVASSAVAQIEAGALHTCARFANDTVRCWGDQTNGKVGNGMTSGSVATSALLPVSNAVFVTAGRAHSCALVASEEVYCWGLNTSGQLGSGDNSSRSIPTLSTSY